MNAESLQSCLALCHPVNCSPSGSSVHGILQVKNTRVSCHALLQGIFPTQGLNSHLLRLLLGQVGSLPLAPPEKPPDSFACSQFFILGWQKPSPGQSNYLFIPPLQPQSWICLKSSSSSDLEAHPPTHTTATPSPLSPLLTLHPLVP